MRAVVQRVSQAQVHVAGELIGECGAGLMILICAMQGDDPAKSAKMAAKISKLRIFKDELGRMNKSILDVGGSALVISQFTLSADTKSGNRPGFSAAAPPDQGEELYEKFCVDLANLGIKTQNGQFGADMDVSLVNQGPVTISLDI